MLDPTRLRAWRRLRGLTQIELADEAKLTPGYISEIERSISTPGPKAARRIAEALNVDIAQIVTDDLQAATRG